ncbi:hypothetical protein [Haloferula sp.]|uniref:hypothetical protein n=1 Tax=Haloferula sp. TaxID=2497595 RepID=UPI003C7850C5
MKPNGACQRIFRDPTPSLPYRRPRNRRKEDRGSNPGDGKLSEKFNYVDVPEGRGRLKMNTAPMVKLGGRIDPPIDLKTVRWGGFLGLIAIGFVANLWISVLMSYVCQILGWDPGFWSERIGGAFVIGLYGVHLFGVAGTSLSRGYRSWGVIAIVAFWTGFLGWIPVGLLVSWLTS